VRPALPIDTYLEQIAGALASCTALVLVAPPGAGKTTRVPPALLDAALAGRGTLTRGNIVVLEPRRIAARAAAMRICEERGVRLGDEVGYRVRFESRAGPRTRLEVVTEGILLRRLERDPFLDGVSVVVLDEFHERSLPSDLALALLREVRGAGRDDLRIVVMSATLDPAPIARFLGDCPIIVTEGRPYPVDISYAPPPSRQAIEDSVVDALVREWSRSSGHALVFLPGAGEIRRTARAIEGFAARQHAFVCALHGRLDLDEQAAVLRPSRERKIILATNVAETSLTIDGVDLVIDSGFARILRNDLRHGIDRLEVVRVSRHSADQRAGRAGRLGPGRAVRLWSEAQHAALPLRAEPEIRRVDLASTVLELRSWGVRDPLSFGWLEAPPSAAIERAEALLERLGALDREGGGLTAIGGRLLAAGVHPRIARLLVAAADAGCVRDGARIAALLEERDIVRYRGLVDRRGAGIGARAGSGLSASSDVLFRLELLDGGAVGSRDLEIDPSALRGVLRLARELERSSRVASSAASRRPGDTDDDALRRALLVAYPDRVVRRRAPGSDRGLMVGGRGVVLATESVVRDAEFFVAVDVDESLAGAEALVRLASAIDVAWLESLFPERIELRSVTRFDDATARVVATATRCYDDLPLEEPRAGHPDADTAREILARVVADRAASIFARDDAATAWLARVRFLRREMPELGLPGFDDRELGALLRPLCAQKTRLDDVLRCDLAGVLRGSLAWSSLQAIDTHAPERLEVPSGSQMRVEYADGRPPSLAVRLQEIFGWSETPRVASGRVPVLLTILGPNHRPVQVTQDLRSFWTTTYHQVRKDLRGRYPKHAWPEDPWTAVASRGPARRRRG